MKNIVVTY